MLVLGSLFIGEKKEEEDGEEEEEEHEEEEEKEEYPVWGPELVGEAGVADSQVWTVVVGGGRTVNRQYSHHSSVVLF